jgi:uncharacterized membrane protein YphA (DoxX/SURF4 family)
MVTLVTAQSFHKAFNLELSQQISTKYRKLHLHQQFLQQLLPKRRMVMQNYVSLINRWDHKITRWMAQYCIPILRVSMGIVFFWFGFLKFFPGLSPAAGLAVQTISKLSFGLIPPNVSIVILATWECLIGLGFLSGKFLRATLFLLFLQMAGTVTPLFLFPQEAFLEQHYREVKFLPTLISLETIRNNNFALECQSFHNMSSIVRWV